MGPGYNGGRGRVYGFARRDEMVSVRVGEFPFTMTMQVQRSTDVDYLTGYDFKI